MMPFLNTLGQRMLGAVSTSATHRNFSTYKFDSLVKWIEEEGKSELASPGFKNPRTRWQRCFKYVPLKYQGDERKKMLEIATIEWIGGALHGLNTGNGKYDSYAIVGNSGTGKTRFLGEIIDNWDHWRALSIEAAKADPTKPSREIPANTLIFPINFSFSTPVTNSELHIFKILKDTYKFDNQVNSIYEHPMTFYAYIIGIISIFFDSLGRPKTFCYDKVSIFLLRCDIIY